MVIQCSSQKEVERVVRWFHCLNEYDSMKGNPGEFGFSWKFISEPHQKIREAVSVLM